MLPKYCGNSWWIISEDICFFSFDYYTSFKSFLKLFLKVYVGDVEEIKKETRELAGEFLLL